jgi:hypothetical protein
MTPALEVRDYEMHRIRNRALGRILRTLVLIEQTKAYAGRARLLASRRLSAPSDLACDQPRRWPRGARAPLRLVKNG